MLLFVVKLYFFIFAINLIYICSIENPDHSYYLKFIKCIKNASVLQIASSLVDRSFTPFVIVHDKISSNSVLILAALKGFFGLKFNINSLV